jgi:hypothetical protein
MRGHRCSWAGGAVAGRGRSARPSGAGVGPYLDPASGCRVFCLVGGLIVQLVAWQARVEERVPGVQPAGTWSSVSLQTRSLAVDRIASMLPSSQAIWTWTSGGSAGTLPVPVPP